MQYQTITQLPLFNTSIPITTTKIIPYNIVIGKVEFTQIFDCSLFVVNF